MIEITKEEERIALTEEEKDTVLSYVEQSYNPQRTELDVQQSHLDRWENKEFRSGDTAELYHEQSKLTDVHTLQETSEEVLQQPAMFAMQVGGGRRRRDAHELIELPPGGELTEDVGAVLQGRESTRNFDTTSFSIETLSTILQYGCGISRTQPAPIGDRTITRHLRTYPSPGALYLIEPYLLVLNVEGLQQGVYHYTPYEHGLRRVTLGGDGFEQRVLDAFPYANEALVETDITDVPVVTVMTGVF